MFSSVQRTALRVAGSSWPCHSGQVALIRCLCCCWPNSLPQGQHTCASKYGSSYPDLVVLATVRRACCMQHSLHIHLTLAGVSTGTETFACHVSARCMLSVDLAHVASAGSTQVLDQDKCDSPARFQPSYPLLLLVPVPPGPGSADSPDIRGHLQQPALHLPGPPGAPQSAVHSLSYSAPIDPGSPPYLCSQ